MNSHRHLFFSLLLLLSTAPRTLAVEPPSLPASPTITSITIPDSEAPQVAELIAEALNNNPSLASLQSRIKAALEMIEPEGALEDPMLEVMMQDVDFPNITIGDAEMSMVGVQFTHEIPYPGKLLARKEVARAEAKVEEAMYYELRRDLVMQIRALYAQLYYLDQQRKSLEVGAELIDMLSATVGARYSVGEAEQEAMIKAQLELSRITEKMIDLAAERKIKVAAINRLLDRPTNSEIGFVGTLPTVADPETSWESEALEHGSAVHIKEAELLSANRMLDVEKLNTKPNFSLGAGVFSRGGFDQVVTLQVGIELPIYAKYKQNPRIRASQHRVESAKQEIRAIQANAREEIARLSAEWKKSLDQIHLYEQAIIPQTSAALDAARVSYINGMGDYSMVIEDFNLWLEARVELEERRADLYKSWAEIEFWTQPGETTVTSDE